MPSPGSRIVRSVNLIALGLAAALAGYLLVSAWQTSSPADVTTSTADSPAEPPTQPQRTGSSVAVVGGMNTDELIQHGLLESPPSTTGGLVPPAGGDGGHAATGPQEVPVASHFPPPVQEAASRYICLCGCPDNLAVCACNEQPIGAFTMLTYLEKLLNETPGADPSVVDQGMAERYGDQVVAGFAATDSN